MNQQTFSLIAGVIFALVSLLHLLRSIFNWEAVVGGWVAPIWISWFGFFVAAFLAYQGFKLSKKSQ
ncbi:MAG: hypothetical protein CO031_02515 [Candidatus Nealsonbacteria bacterium CG_4_9_14_0_2_um_filter_37_38]|uniref:Uncharacterized protein n=1 Tax=Candidatus Nealsonbacteria bacterium CG_4_10_14_0_8_um_filter_37_14 TaxID=1974684 RepID=A0A2M7R679_9BACT|nr:MAG: hypothetical protein COV63_01755 [Candidatus Nealsonbacteria bacterium CG11_big_fil_rev_8_21_14_0_20_37_68]PIY89061.1 MAG: hypothetical protein COY73_02055 [Candidatus Nealsonbacteria bacterium CG_4_10_14_0_8_um_filter_37_14]PJC51464.1 MAG: hypothetical protein CO031_02515 [Candidatus Nealsonbacteria bacterium CG_4_9_14_0_2_um_filter_37_38]